MNILHCCSSGGNYLISDNGKVIPLPQELDDSFFSCVRGFGTVRVFGTPGNLVRLSTLYRGGVDILLGNPSVLFYSNSSDIQSLMDAAHDIPDNPNRGGWRPIGDSDVLLSDVLMGMRSKSLSKDLKDRVFSGLSVCKPLSFIDGMSSDVVQILAEYFDPRWYVDWRHPMRGGKFKAHAGFHLVRDGDLWRTVDPRKDADSGMFNVGLYYLVTSTVIPWVRPKVAREGPRDFLRREWLDYYRRVMVTKSNMKPVFGRRMADIKMIQRFLVFLRLVWMDDIYGSSVFDPLQFFKYEDVISAYAIHMGYPEIRRKEATPIAAEARSVAEEIPPTVVEARPVAVGAV